MIDPSAADLWETRPSPGARPSRRCAARRPQRVHDHADALKCAQLDRIEQRNGCRDTALATDTRTQHAFLDARHRAHARVGNRLVRHLGAGMKLTIRVAVGSYSSSRRGTRAV